MTNNTVLSLQKPFHLYQKQTSITGNRVTVTFIKGSLGPGESTRLSGHFRARVETEAIEILRVHTRYIITIRD